MCSFAFSKLRKYVTVEPVLFFAFVAIEIMTFLTKNLYLQKTCRNDTSFEPDLSTPCDDEKRGITFISTVYNNAVLPVMGLSVIFTMFASNYSDLAGKKRKVFIIAAIIGTMLWAVSAMLQSIFWYWPPTAGIIANVLLMDAFGGYLSLINFIYGHLFDETSNENRLTRITILSVVQSMATLVGRGSAGHLLREYGFLGSFFLCFLFQLMALISTFVFVHEEPVPIKRALNLKKIFGMKQMYEMFEIILFPKKPKKHVITIWMLQLIHLLAFFSFFGDESVYYLYFRHRFHWSEDKFSSYSAYRLVSSMIGGMLCTLVMSKWLKLHDGVVGAFAAFCDTLSFVGFYFATEEWHLYVVPLFDIFNGLALSTCSSLMSQFFTEEEFGRMNSTKMLFITISAIGIPVYNFSFNSTMDTFPNAFFLLSIFLSATICVLYSITFFLSRNIRTADHSSKAAW